MLIKYILLLLVVLAICIIFKNKYYVERFESGPVDFELLENTEIDGSFTPKSLVGAVDIKSGIVNINFNIGGKNIIINNLYKLDFNYTIGTKYSYKIVLFPLEHYLILLINDNVIYSKYLYTVKLSNNKLEVLVQNGHTITNITTIKSPLQFLNISNTLYKIGNDIYDVQMNNKYYSFRNIKNNLYLGVAKKDTVKSPDNKLIILADKNRYIIINESSKLMGDWKNGISIFKVINANTWLTYGSTINIINNTKQYLSSNKNLKYDFKGASGLSAVYCDNIASNELISWTIKDLIDSPNKPLVKNGNAIYLSNNNMYLQIIHGNPTPNKLGIEVSIGNEKNDNSKWIIMSVNSRLFKKDSNIYLYHPKTDSYLYNTGKQFTLVKMLKNEVVGLDVKDNKATWTISNIILPTINNIDDSIDYYKFNKEKMYINEREAQWKKMLDSENEKVKERLRNYNKLKGVSDDIEAGINKIKVNINNIFKSKCPSKIPIDNKEANSSYDIIYEKKPNMNPKKYLMNTNKIMPCEYKSIESIPEVKIKN